MKDHEAATLKISIDECKGEFENFEKVFQVILDECLFDENSNGEHVADATKHFQKVCNYNVPNGKKMRGMAVVMSFLYLAQDPSDKDVFRARILGWCVEWLQASFLIVDDINDHSCTRRGRACWYKHNEVGMMAINDSFFLEAMVYKILKKYFRSQPYYSDIIDLFQESTKKTVSGQALDLLTADDGVVDFSRFSMERYDVIVKAKTSHYSFYLPVALALRIAGIGDEAAYAEAKEILLEMGHFFQVQDDYLDCYGDPEVTGKIGTDIEDNKCGWLINKALLICSEEQRAVLEANYARNDPESVKKVKQIYMDLQLQKIYKEYEEASYRSLMSKINALSHPDLSSEVFISFANKLFKRIK